MEQNALLRSIDYGIAHRYDLGDNDDIINQLETGINFIRECAEIDKHLIMSSRDDMMIRESITDSVKKVVEWIIALFKKLGDSLKSYWNKFTGKNADGLRKRSAVLESDLNVISKNKTDSKNEVYFTYIAIEDIFKLFDESYPVGDWLTYDVAKKGDGDNSLSKTLSVCKDNISAFDSGVDPSDSKLKAVQDKILSLQESIKSNNSKSSNANLNIFMSRCEEFVKKVVPDVEKVKSISNIGSLMFDVKEIKTTPVDMLRKFSVYNETPKFINLMLTLADKNIKDLEAFDKDVYALLDKIKGQPTVKDSDAKKEDLPPETDDDKKEEAKADAPKKEMSMEMSKTASMLNQLLASSKTISSVVYDITSMWDVASNKVLANAETYTKLLLKNK